MPQELSQQSRLQLDFGALDLPFLELKCWEMGRGAERSGSRWKKILFCHRKKSFVFS